MSKQAIGYGQPPKSTRFNKGQSGNPCGRPKNRRREIPCGIVFGQMVMIRKDGRECRVTAAEAFLLQLTQKGLPGDSAAACASLEAVEAAVVVRQDAHQGISSIAMKVVNSGADSIIDTLGIARLKYPSDETRVRWELNP